MSFSSVSPTPTIFCLVAPNMPLCLSAVTTQLIYIYLHIQEVTTENCIYFKRAEKLYISGYLFTEEKGVFLWVEQIHRCYEFDQIWSEVSLKKYDKCLWEENQRSVNSIT